MRAAFLSYLTVAGLAVSACAGTLYVDDNAPSGGDGSSWAAAFTHLQDALAIATIGDEIWIAGGTYRPDQSEAGGVTPGDRSASFHLASGVEIYGGYAGSADPGNPDIRSVALYETLLSGDLSGNDDPNNVLLNRGDNSYHVVVASDTDASARLDGVTISGGFAVAYNGQPNGGGVYMVNGSATFANCAIRRNATYSEYAANVPGPNTGDGAGVYAQGGTPTFTGCTVSDNATGAGKDGIQPTLAPTTAGGNGGGLCFRGALAALTDCQILRNRAGNGGSDNGYSEIAVPGAAGGSGGAVYLSDNAGATLVRCTINNNAAGAGGNGSDGVSAGVGGTGGTGGGVSANNSNISFTSCSLSGNVSGAGGIGGDGYGTMGSGGGASGGAAGSGGALFASNCTTEVADSGFTGNHTAQGGLGGIGGYQEGHSGAGGRGGNGGALCLAGPLATIRNCRFLQNSTGAGGGGGRGGCNGGVPQFCGGYGGAGGHAGDGGALYLSGATLSVLSCQVAGNSTGAGGAGGEGSLPGFVCFYCTGGVGGDAGDAAGLFIAGAPTSFTLADCILAGNTTGQGGTGGMGTVQANGGKAGRSAGLRSEPQLTVRNCTVANNVVGNPGDPNGAVALTGGAELLAGGTVYDTILWGNAGAAATVEGRQIAGTPLTVNYCDVQGWTGGLGGVGNSGTNPSFVDAGNGDYHLATGSPCINAGDSGFVPLPDETDIDGQPRVLGGRVDIGADEWFPPTPGDLNCDGSVSFKDINPFVQALSNPSAWQATYLGCPALNGDTNGDGSVSFKDINPFVALLSGGR